MKNIWFRLKLAWYAYKFPSQAVTVQKINGQLAKGHRMGIRGTPVISFWPMREKWLRQPPYWEQYGSDGDETIATGLNVVPARYRLIYIKIPTMNMVCQLAYELTEGSARAWDDDNGEIKWADPYELRRLILDSGKKRTA